ncbi:MAG: hypothetical protein APZ16_05950 [Candidatus Hadarchaeum yellowstonense]|jgi:uncharacterized membrane protein (Fun14 family)|uniref:FUN14 family protein n=1 Tax=Hadarchaeum yellowstonense TaxID=1776334 RepID=A0A147JV36_HADYE|nr:MAG: hypothetical protein APZ16_05950 [Candidatus Hadarchaeum yellowstonense]
MSMPAEIAWLVPIVASFIIGLLVGAIVKKAFNLMVLLVALIIVLVATGALSLSFHDLFDRAMEILPKLYEAGSGWLNVLPYSSVAFLLGLAIGLWKG